MIFINSPQFDLQSRKMTSQSVLLVVGGLVVAWWAWHLTPPGHSSGRGGLWACSSLKSLSVSVSGSTWAAFYSSRATSGLRLFTAVKVGTDTDAGMRTCLPDRLSPETADHPFANGNPPP